MANVDGATWKVGQLARLTGLTGLTVRTLHHYDELGLSRPSGHRLYDEHDVRRLYGSWHCASWGSCWSSFTAATRDCGTRCTECGPTTARWSSRSTAARHQSRSTTYVGRTPRPHRDRAHKG